MGGLTNTTLVLLLSMMAPPLVSYLKNCAWPVWAKQLTLLGVSMVFAALQALADTLATGVWSWSLYLASAPSIFTLATLLYTSRFKDTLLNRDLENSSIGPFLGDTSKEG